MMCPDAGLVKVLFHKLVVRCGGTDAAGEKLGVSQQRVSQLQNPNCADLPTLAQVLVLERWVQDPIVTSGLANCVRDSAQRGDLARETRQATYAAVDLQRGVDEGASRDELRARAQRLASELHDVNQALTAEQNAA